PIIKSKLEWKNPITVDMWRIAQRLTHKVVKAVLTGPYTMMDWSFNEYYESRESACRDLTAILRREIVALSEAGVKIIEIDESALSARHEEFSLVADALKDLTHSVRSYFILHHAYGNWESLWNKIERLPVDNFSFEMTNSDFDSLRAFKKNPTKKDVTIGV